MEQAKKRRKLSISIKMLIGMVLGLIVGTAIGEPITVIEPFGTLFINLLKMCMVPVIFTSIVLSVAQVSDVGQFGRIGGRMLLYFAVTNVIAAIIGGSLAMWIQPGNALAGGQISGQVAARETPSVADTLLNIVPVNPVAAMAEGNLLAIIFFACMLGVSLIFIGEKKAPVVNFMESLFDAILQMVSLCLQYAPIGVFALMAVLAGKYGLNVLKPLSLFFATEYMAILLMLIVVYGILLYMTTRLNIFKFLYRCKDPLLVAFTTASGSAAVAVELQQAESHYGIPDKIAGFGLTVGTTINQNGAALNIPICVLFTAQVYGFQFSMTELVTIITMAIIMSCGAAGVPASATVFTLSILSGFGIPVEAFSLILASYIIIDLGLTVINVAGDILCVVIACRKEKILIEEVWQPGYDADAVLRQKISG